MAKESSFEGREIKEYDFKNPDAVAKGELSDIQLIFETFINLAKDTFAGRFRTTVEMELSQVNRSTFGEFLGAAPASSTLTVVELSPWTKKNIFQIEPNLAFDFIERLLGGKGGAASVDRQPTEIELSMNKKVIESFLPDLASSFKDLVSLQPKVLAVESNPKRVQVLPESEIVILCKIKAKIGETEGLIVLCFPIVNLEKVMDKLALGDEDTPSGNEVSKEESEKMKKGLSGVKVPVIAELGEINLSVKELLELTLQDVIRLNVKPNDELILKVGEHPKFKYRPGTSGKRMAAQVSQVL